MTELRLPWLSEKVEKDLSDTAASIQAAVEAEDWEVAEALVAFAFEAFMLRPVTAQEYGRECFAEALCRLEDLGSRVPAPVGPGADA